MQLSSCLSRCVGWSGPVRSLQQAGSAWLRAVESGTMKFRYTAAAPCVYTYSEQYIYVDIYSPTPDVCPHTLLLNRCSTCYNMCILQYSISYSTEFRVYLVLVIMMHSRVSTRKRATAVGNNCTSKPCVFGGLRLPINNRARTLLQLNDMFFSALQLLIRGHVLYSLEAPGGLLIYPKMTTTTSLGYPGTIYTPEYIHTGIYIYDTRYTVVTPLGPMLFKNGNGTGNFWKRLFLHHASSPFICCGKTAVTPCRSLVGLGCETRT